MSRTIPQIGILYFPGTNCERETQRALAYAGLSAVILPSWSATESDFVACDAYIIPGGFSYQDRVRAGAIASTLPMIDWLRVAAEADKPILGICNGCQILANSGILPGVALDVNGDSRNNAAGFLCEWVFVKLVQDTLFTTGMPAVLPIPINHGEGRFLFDSAHNSDSHSNPAWQYCTVSGDVEPGANPNGSMQNTAGISNKTGTVLAVMPHPERAAFLYQLPDQVYNAHTAGADLAKDPHYPGPFMPLFLNLASYLS